MAKIKTRCSKCPYGPYNDLSDWCESCTHDPEAGWFGFTDHSIGVYFTSDEEQEKFYRENEIVD